jgi:predicted nucleic acid-binding protein
MGNRGGRKELLANYERMDRAPNVPHAEVVAFVRDRKLQGRGIGWIDAHLLASALVGRLRLWTIDPALAELASDLGVAFE